MYAESIDVAFDDERSRLAVRKAVDSQNLWIYHLFSTAFPGLTLVAGFLTTERARRGPSRSRPAGSLPPFSATDLERSSSAADCSAFSLAITSLFVAPEYRKRGVAEALVRSAVRYYLVEKGYTTISAYVDPEDEIVCRVFRRVAFGIPTVEQLAVTTHGGWEENDREARRERNAERDDANSTHPIHDIHTDWRTRIRPMNREPIPSRHLRNCLLRQSARANDRARFDSQRDMCTSTAFTSKPSATEGEAAADYPSTLLTQDAVLRLSQVAQSTVADEDVDVASPGQFFLRLQFP